MLGASGDSADVSVVELKRPWVSISERLMFDFGSFLYPRVMFAINLISVSLSFLICKTELGRVSNEIIMRHAQCGVAT